MANDTLTFELGGRVELGQFHEGIHRFRQLVEALTPRKGVKWVVEDLQPGSAVITLRGVSESPDKVEKIVSDYGNIGKSLETNTQLHYNRRVQRAAERVQYVAETVEYVRFETPLVDYTVFGVGIVKEDRQSRVGIGAGDRKGTNTQQPRQPPLQFVRYHSRQGRFLLSSAGPGRPDERGMGTSGQGQWSSVQGKPLPVCRKLSGKSKI